MENLTAHSFVFSELFMAIQEAYSIHFGIDLPNETLKHEVTNFFKNFNNGLFCYLEFPYVEKFYRDSYYNYHSKKNNIYPRDCIRICFFKEEIISADFRDTNSFIKIQNSFVGFVTLKPYSKNIFGRSIISKESLVYKDMMIIEAEYKLMLNGVKIKVKGFPHNGSDDECMRCGEISVCNIMDYLSNKYQEYKQCLPSELHKVLHSITTERRLPSKGIDINDISFALREFKLDSLKYDRKEFVNFEEIITYYVESGIPVIGVYENDLINILDTEVEFNTGSVADSDEVENTKQKIIDDRIERNLELSRYHAFIIIGRTSYNYENVGQLESQIVDSTLLVDKFVIVDDTDGPLSVIKSFNQGEYLIDDILSRITGIVAPLPSKVHLDADKARITFESLINEYFHDHSLVKRVYLTTNRSFKSHVNSLEKFDLDLKSLIIEMAMPKYIWICELYEKHSMAKELLYSIFILDASESNKESISNVLLLGLLENEIIKSDNTLNNFKSLPLQPNLSGWKLYSNLK